MADHLRQTIADLQVQLAKKLAEVAKIKDTINRVSELAGDAPPYAEEDAPEEIAAAIRSDTFYGQQLHAAMRKYLEKRGKAQGPATVAEIHAALTKGGYEFGSDSVDNAKRVIRITLTKNSSVFHKLPNGSYGLLAWYPNVKKPKKAEGDEGDDAADDGATKEDTTT